MNSIIQYPLFLKKSIDAYVWINGQKDGGENVLGEQWMQDEPA